LLSAFISTARTDTRSPSIETIRAQALTAIAGNEEKIRELVADRQQWWEFRAANGQLRYVTPRMNSEIQWERDKPSAEVIAGWEDQPLTGYDNDSKRAAGPGFVPASTESLLRTPRNLEMLGQIVDNNRHAYLIKSSPSSVPAISSNSDRCADGLEAVLFIDSTSHHPIRIDSVVVEGGHCPGGAAQGARIYQQWALVSGIWTEKRREQSDRLDIRRPETLTIGRGSLFQRGFKLSPEWTGGTMKSVSVRGNFRVFTVTSQFIADGITPPKPTNSPAPAEAIEFFPIERVAFKADIYLQQSTSRGR